MYTIKEVLEWINDPEIKEWFSAYLVRKYGPESLDKNPESWFNSLGGVIHDRHVSHDHYVQKAEFVYIKDYIRLHNFYEDVSGFNFSAPFSYVINSSTEPADRCKALTAFYALMSHLSRRPHWYQNYQENIPAGMQKVLDSNGEIVYIKT